MDDLRLALQRSGMMLPYENDTAALYFFVETENVWQLPSEHLCNALVAVSEAMSPAIEVVIENHIDTQCPRSDRGRWHSSLAICTAIGA